MNYDYNHREGLFNYALVFIKNWDAFDLELVKIRKNMLYAFPEGEARKHFERESDDRIWNTDRKSGDYRTLAVKMAWNIDHAFKGTAVDIASGVNTWEDFQEIRELYHLDRDFSELKRQVDREFNSTNLFKGLDYLAGINSWNKKYIEKAKKQILIYESRKESRDPVRTQEDIISQLINDQYKKEFKNNTSK